MVVNYCLVCAPHFALYIFTATSVLGGPKRLGLYNQGYFYFCKGKSLLTDEVGHLNLNFSQIYHRPSHLPFSPLAANGGIQKVSNHHSVPKELTALSESAQAWVGNFDAFKGHDPGNSA